MSALRLLESSQTSLMQHESRIHQMQIVFTVDTEFYPISANWQRHSLTEDIERDIYGKTPSGHFGLIYQLDTFRNHGVKAVFFVESLFANCPQAGFEPLRRIVDLIQSYGQEVQLHLHPEWLMHLPSCPVEYKGGLLRDYSEDDQLRLLDIATDNLVRAGAKVPVAFRAGDYGANRDTLRALVRLGFKFDCSYNYPYTATTCDLSSLGPTWDSRPTDGLWEVPVSCFEDWPRHYRHCQLSACSTREVASALYLAELRGWNTFTILSHSFEMLANRWSSRPIASRPAVIARFQDLCRHIGSGSELTTAHFGDLTLTGASAHSIQGSVINTALRYCEQFAGRLRARFA